ncbi:T9SS type A sorting domain-containing protein [candidate division WOR-3 bacterium]|nr:T9SS type A sorting domain-containing protein [candidate division WOR-3 bacterium]
MHSYDDVSVEKEGIYSLVSIVGGRIMRTGGVPSLPTVKVMYSIPAASELTQVKITDEEWIPLGTHRIFPAQNPCPYGFADDFQSEDTSIYSADKYYPETILENFFTGNKSGFMLGCVCFCPFRYNPVTGDLQLLASAKVTVKYNEGTSEAVFLAAEQIRIFGEDVKSLVANPEDVRTNSPQEKFSVNGYYEYVIIAPEYLSPYFEELLRWKTEKGVRAGLFTKEWITSTYPGRDDLEKMREFVKDYHRNHGLIYLVLAGDYENLGARMVPVKVGTSYSENASCDMYFSDVVPYSSDWDANGNLLYGELSVDGCDWFSDVYVGRFPVTEPYQVLKYIDKVLTYEMYPPHGFLEKSLQGGGLLWPSYNHYGSILCDSIADNCLPPNWSHTKMYESFYFHPNGFSDSLSRGYGWCHIASHGNENGTYWHNSPNDMMTKLMADALTNGMKIGVVHSIACEAGWFDQKDCLAEHLFNSPNGGAVAGIFNSRYGWGQAPGLGSSDWLSLWTADAVYRLDLKNIGRALSIAKDKIVFGINSNPMTDMDHWSMVELNLFGDPQTQIYSREPTAMTVNHSPRLNQGNYNFIVSVFSGKQPLVNASCCLSRHQSSEIWFEAKTGTDGFANIAYSIADNSPVVFTVYTPDHLFYRETLQISLNEPYVVMAYIDTICGGQENGQLSPGMSYEMYVAAANWGISKATGVQAFLATDDSGIALMADTLFFGDINPYDTIISTDPLGFTLAYGLLDDHKIPLDFVCFDDSGRIWTTSFFLEVNSENLKVVNCYGPSVIMPGNDFNVSVSIENSGSGTADQIQMQLRKVGNESFFSFADSVEIVNTIPPNSTMRFDDAFEISVSASCSMSHYCEFELRQQAADSNVFYDTFTLAVGSVVFEENFDSEVHWAYSGSTAWNVTTRKWHSPLKSMYCGNSLGYYENGVNDSRVISKDIFCTSNSVLSFWHLYRIQNEYDGCRIEFSTDGGGSWFPLFPEEGYTGVSSGFGGYNFGDSFYTGSHYVWAMQNAIVPVQGYMKFAWRFGSDSTINDIGYFFDDVSLKLHSGTSVGEQTRSPRISETDFSILNVYPNPSGGRFFIKFSVPFVTHVKLAVFDATGRIVSELIDEVLEEGIYSANWDGRDERGRMVSSGTYFYFFNANGLNTTGKFVLLR